MTETRCNRCSYEGHERKGTSTEPGWQCPWCGAGLFRRAGASPKLSTHATAVVRAALSLRGVLFVGFYAAITVAPIPFSSVIAAALLALVSVRFAHRAMLVSRGHVDFPEIDSNDLLDFSWFLPVLAYSVLFTVVPTALLITGVAASVGGVALIAGGLALLLYAPMGLVSILRTGSGWSLLSIPTGVRHIAGDLGGYAGLVLAFAVVTGADVVIAFGNASYLVGVVLQAGSAIAQLVVYGLAGLWVRQNARRLDVACDDEDWLPVHEVSYEPLSSRRRGLVVRPAREVAPIDMPEWSPGAIESPYGHRPATTDVPLVTGQALAEDVRAAPAPVDWPPMPTTNP